MSTPAKAFEEAHERHEHGREGARWVPLAAAVLAVLAAVSGYFGNLRSTEALVEKNDAIVATTKASDTWAQYQAERIKYYIAQTALDGGVGPGANASRLKQNAAEEGAKAPPLMTKARAHEEEAVHHNERSERLLKQHETIEVGTTLFEVAIVLVSITVLVGSRLLPFASATAALLGVVFFVLGLTR
ncbi:MAG TPA: DUF4337 family protein [Dongiaceae bacterium]|nr:DUF4337 family protein [Dongiaceae bacterium]